VHDSGPAGRKSADGGHVGHFAVNKMTVQVFDDVLFKEVTSNALKAAQRDLRVKHCIHGRDVKEGK
jgi:hypothetical protein